LSRRRTAGRDQHHHGPFCLHPYLCPSLHLDHSQPLVSFRCGPTTCAEVSAGGSTGSHIGAATGSSTCCSKKETFRACLLTCRASMCQACEKHKRHGQCQCPDTCPTFSCHGYLPGTLNHKRLFQHNLTALCTQKMLDESLSIAPFPDLSG
jgi:hypothetical protein